MIVQDTEQGFVILEGTSHNIIDFLNQINVDEYAFLDVIKESEFDVIDGVVYFKTLTAASRAKNYIKLLREKLLFSAVLSKKSDKIYEVGIMFKDGINYDPDRFKFLFGVDDFEYLLESEYRGRIMHGRINFHINHKDLALKFVEKTNELLSNKIEIESVKDLCFIPIGEHYNKYLDCDIYLFMNFLQNEFGKLCKSGHVFNYIDKEEFADYLLTEFNVHSKEQISLIMY